MKLTFIVIFLAISSLILFSCSNSKLQQGNEIISKIEKFKSDNGRLPNNLSEIGISESENCPCYQKESDSKYIVWYGK